MHIPQVMDINENHDCQITVLSQRILSIILSKLRLNSSYYEDTLCSENLLFKDNMIKIILSFNPDKNLNLGQQTVSAPYPANQTYMIL